MAEKILWPSWRFGPGGKKAVFESEDDVPAGWVDHPSKVGKAEPKAEPKPATKRTRKPKAEPKPAAKQAPVANLDL